MKNGWGFICLLVTLCAAAPERALGDLVGRLEGSFNVNDSGAAVYTVKIAVPPGTRGIEPELSLNYDSSGSDGLLGLGWSLGGLSAITRCPPNFALDEGVSLVNDISGLQFDPEMGPLVAARGVAVVLMHMRGRPDDMYAHAQYQDVVTEVARELQRAVERAIGAGIAWDRILLDPGLGFAKRAEHSLSLLANGNRLAELGRPLLFGPSRKSFLTAATGPMPAAQRDWPAAAAVTAAVLGGAHIVRVHRVREMVQVVRVADAVRAAARS